MAYTKTRTFNLTCDTSEFVKNSEELINELIEEAPEDVRYAAQVFANIAAKSTPPSIGKTSIDKKYYDRPFIVLIRLIRGGYHGMMATQEDIDAFKAGMVYKVLSTNGHKMKENVGVGYCKTKGELKKLRKIPTRGLMRVMWGKDLADVGANVPIAIERLLNKSPELKKLPYNINTLAVDKNEVTLEIINEAKDIERVAAYAKRKALASTQKALERRVQARVARKNKEL